MTELRDNIFAIEVPQGAEQFETSLQPDNIPCVTYWYWENLDATVVSLPPGSYEILFTTKEVTEEQAETISPGKWSKYFENAPGPLFKDYSDNIYRFDNAIQSLQSLLKSKGLTAGNYLIIKKVG